jgi:ABC-type multidrug transport system ATPase subunit
LADRITFLSGGKVIFDGTLEQAEAEGPQEVRDFLARKPSDPGGKRPPIPFRLED